MQLLEKGSLNEQGPQSRMVRFVKVESIVHTKQFSVRAHRMCTEGVVHGDGEVTIISACRCIPPVFVSLEPCGYKDRKNKTKNARCLTVPALPRVDPCCLQHGYFPDGMLPGPLAPSAPTPSLSHTALNDHRGSL